MDCSVSQGQSGVQRSRKGHAEVTHALNKGSRYSGSLCEPLQNIKPHTNSSDPLPSDGLKEVERERERERVKEREEKERG